MSKFKKSDLSSKLDELTKALDQSSKELIQGPPIDIIDLSIPYNHMFSAAAKRGMSREVKDLSPKRKITSIYGIDNETVDKVQFFSAVAIGQEKIVKAARFITDLINQYAAKGHITGCMAKLGAVKLATEPHELERYIVFCYVSMTEDGSKLAAEDKSQFIIQEGQVGPDVM